MSCVSFYFNFFIHDSWLTFEGIDFHFFSLSLSLRYKLMYEILLVWNVGDKYWTGKSEY